jgi:DNA-binding CsgD family transcriptional regulator
MNGRSLEACAAPVEGTPVRVLTLQERAGLTLEDVKPHLLARGVSEREIDVVGCVLQGMRNAAIAQALFISEYTVKDHLKHVFAKLSVSSRGDLICALHASARPARPASEAAPRRGQKPQPIESNRPTNLKM